MIEKEHVAINTFFTTSFSWPKTESRDRKLLLSWINSVFDNTFQRWWNENNKEQVCLITFSFREVKPTENTDSGIIVDEGALVQPCNWTKGEKFSKIFEMYIDRWKKFNINTVVFNWYNKSLKMLHTKQEPIKCLKLLKLVMKMRGT